MGLAAATQIAARQEALLELRRGTGPGTWDQAVTRILEEMQGLSEGRAQSVRCAAATWASFARVLGTNLAIASCHY